MKTWKKVLIIGSLCTLAGAFTALGAPGYENIAVSRVSGSVNIRTEANTSSTVVGKINNDCAAEILETVEGEGGQWYKIRSGSVTGYIKAEYFVTGEAAAAKAKEVGHTYGTIKGATTVRLRETPDLNGRTLTPLSQGAICSVTGQEGDFYKVAVDTDLEGYVSKEYIETETEFKEAVSTEEEQAQAEEKAQAQKEADAAIQALEQAKAQQQDSGFSSASKKTSSGIPVIEANPEKGTQENVAAPVVSKPEDVAKNTQTDSNGPSAGNEDSSKVVSASRNAVVAYAKQFLGNPYVYGGTSLTNGADCSGFVMSVFSHFGISTGRSSREQAGKGKTISVNEVQPGDLLFYASGDYINHVGIYVGDGKIIHASNPATGICYAPANYRTPCKAISFFD